MKINKPVTNNEVVIAPEQTLVTKTDTKGNITYINNAFIDVSGFSEEELKGKQHNIIRHPDVPSEAFRDLWDTIQDGKTWSAPVKNRCKDGSFYWVMSNVSPIYDKNGEIVEYVSIRRGLSDQEKNDAIGLYKRLRNGEARLYNGRLITSKFSKISSIMNNLKVGYKVGLSVFFSFLISLTLIYLLIAEKNIVIEKIEQQHAGLIQINSIRAFLQFIPQHRGKTNGYLKGETRAKPVILSIRKIINKNMDKAIEVANSTDNAFGTRSKIEALKKQWKSIESQAFNLETSDSFKRHTNLITKVLGLIQEISDDSKLSLANKLDEKYLLDSITQHIPFITEEMGKARGLGNGIVSAKKITPLQHQKLSELLVNIKMTNDALDRGFKKIYGVNKELQEKLKPDTDNLSKQLEIFKNNIYLVLNKDFSKFTPKQYFDSGTAPIDSAFDIFDIIIPKFENTIMENHEIIESEKLNMIIAVVLILLFILTSSIFLIKHISNSLDSIISSLAEIGSGNFFSHICYKGDDELGQVLCALKKMQIVLGYDLDKSAQLANRNARIKVALDNVDSPVIVANRDNKVIYINQSAQNLFNKHENKIKTELPEFAATDIINNQMDLFGDGETNNKMIPSLTSSKTQIIEIGGLTFKVTISPVVNDEGERLGAVSEWIDMTQQLSIEAEIDAVVTKVVDGDLSNTISLEGKDGFLLNLSEGINSIIYVVDNALKDVENSLSMLSTGDLTYKVNKDYSGIFAVLINNINITVDKLYEVVSEIQMASGHIDTSSKEIESGNKDMSTRTEQQASNLEETASSMEELTSIVKNNAANASQAQEISHQANIAAEKGGKIIINAVHAMDEINTSSTKISDIIGVIDEIAFQTNLLALNASVEAARAGEQGRGFAVVASEVRNLAQRSATAAKEIKELIIDSVGKVQNGSELVNQSGETLNNIVESTQKAGTLITEIASASKEQAIGIEQVNEAITQMEVITQQNASLAEQTSAASMNLATQADTLNEMINFFKINR